MKENEININDNQVEDEINTNSNQNDDKEIKNEEIKFENINEVEPEVEPANNIPNNNTDSVELKVPVGQYVGSEKTRRNEGEKIIKNYKTKTTLEDKMAFYMYFRIKYDAHLKSYHEDVSNGILNVPVDMPEEERNQTIEKYQKIIDDNVEWRKQHGINPSAEATLDQDELHEQLYSMVLKDIVGDGSTKAVLEGLKKFSVINGWIDSKCKEEYFERLNQFDKNDPLRERKAQYLTRYAVNSEANQLQSVLNTMRFTALSDLTNCADDGDPHGIGDTIFNSLHFNKQMKMSVFLNRIGFNSEEKKHFLTMYDCSNDDLVYDVFKSDLQKGGNPNPSEEDILRGIKHTYVENVVNVVNFAYSGDPNYLFDRYYNDDMTISHYMSIMNYNAEEQKAFLAENGIQETDKVKDVFREKLKNDLDAQKEYNENDGKEVFELDDHHIMTYAKDFVKAEADRTDKFHLYKFRNETTVERYMNILGLEANEKTAFLNKFNAKADEKIKDVFEREITKNMSPEEKEKVTEKDVFAYAQNYKNQEFDRMKKEGRDVPFINYGLKIRDDYFRAFEVSGDRKTQQMVSLLSSESSGVDPKSNPKTQVEKDFKNWAKTEGEKFVEENKLINLGTTIDVINEKTINNQPIKVREHKDVKQYLDSQVTTTNDLFLRGVIDALEATKTGSGTFHSKNTDKYNNMLKALKKYENKVAMINTEGTDGLLETKQALIEACKNYVLRRKSKRSTDFGEARFEAAATLLYKLMPKNEYTQWMNDVNSHRSDPADQVTWEKLATQEAKYFTSAQSKIEDSQSASNGNRTRIPETCSDKMALIDNLYGFKPATNANLIELFGQENINEKMISAEAGFVPIGSSEVRKSLSEKDFAALAYAGTMTTEAAAEENRHTAYPQLKTLVTGKYYGTELMKEPIPSECKYHLDAIVAGRNSAINAMNEYATGDKYPLAHVISSGIRHIAAAARASEKVDDNFILYSEMGSRLMEMLERDEELKTLAITKNETEKIKEDYEFIKSINEAAKIRKNSVEASKNLEWFAVNKPDAKRSEKEELVTDIVMNKFLDYSVKKLAEKRESTNTYKKLNEDALAVAQGAMKGLVAARQAHAISDEEFKRQAKIVDDQVSLERLIHADRSRNCTLEVMVPDDESVKELRKNIKELVKDSGICKKSIADIQKELKSEKKLVSKLASLSQKTRETKLVEQAKKAAEKRLTTPTL